MESGAIFQNRVPEGLPCGQFVYSAEEDQRLLYADINVAHLYGCESVEEFVAYVKHSFRNMVHPEDWEAAEASIRIQTAESGNRHDYLRYRILTKQGEIRYIEDFGHYLFDRDGRSYYYVFIVEIPREEYLNEYFNSFAEGQVDAMNWQIDHLTGLKNILACQEELESSLPEGGNGLCTVAVFDIIGLLDVNHQLGRIEGDKRIRALVQAVSSCMPKGTLLYRGYDAEIITLSPGKGEPEVIDAVKETARACQSLVFFGIASTRGGLIASDGARKTGTVLQALEEAQYDLNIKKMLHEGSVRSQSLTSLVRALEEVDQDTEEHVLRTRSMGVALGKRLGLSDAQLTTLELLCLLHDIGKIAIPLEILNKPGKLTEAEWATLRSHAEKGYEIAIATKELRPIADTIRYHHERWDGQGYPARLAGEEIPVLSRIISIVDAYDAMVNDRCYRKALSTEYAMREIRDNAGTQFDPHMAQVFLRLLAENPELALGKKTGAGEVRVFRKATQRAAAEGNTQPVAYCEYKLDVDDKIIEAGLSFETITGYPLKEVLGKMSQLDLIPPEDLEDYQVQVGNQFAKSNTAYLRHRIRRKDGSFIWVICHGERQFDSATRSFVSTIQIYENMSDDKEEVREKLDRARKVEDLNQTITSLLNNMPGMTFTKDAVTGVYLACNQAFAEYAHKAAPEGVVGLTDAEIFDPETAAHFVEDDRMALSMEKPYLFFEDVLDAAGSQRQFQTTKLKYFDASGRLCLQGMCQDVTDLIRVQREKDSAKRAYEEARSNVVIYTHIAQALARGITDLFYVNMETDELIEYHTDDASGVLAEARRSADFFEGCSRDAKLFVHPDDQEAFVRAMDRDYLEAALKESKVFELIYRRIKDGRSFYVQMRVTRVEDDPRFIVIAVADVDELMRKRRLEERMQEERVVYARLHALTGNFICVYVVDPETGHYREFSATSDYVENFSQAKGGTDFFATLREAARVYAHPEDVDRVLPQLCQEKVMAEVERSGAFTLGYRIMMEGKPRHIQMKAAMVEEKEGPRLIVGLNDIDAQVRREEEVERRLLQAQNQANVDALTGVKNKHAYLEAEALLDRQISEHRAAPFAIVMLDVNDLKKVNDTEGHQAGDMLLREASRVVCDIFKRSPVFRVGGDEFAVIAQGKDYADIEERLRLLHDHNREARRTGHAVVACGMSAFDNDPCVANVFERADHRMYENKNALKSAR